MYGARDDSRLRLPLPICFLQFICKYIRLFFVFDLSSPSTSSILFFLFFGHVVVVVCDGRFRIAPCITIPDGEVVGDHFTTVSSSSGCVATYNAI